MTLFAPAFEASLDVFEDFRRVSDEICALARPFGVTIRPYADSQLPHFARLNPAKRLRALRIISHQRDSLLVAQAEGIHPNSPQFIWRTFARMNMTPQPDIFDKISTEDTVEVYNWDGTSSFKNLKFFEFISLTVEELYCMPWTEQWAVSAKMFLFFMEMNAKLRIAHYERTFEPRFNRYLLTEKLGDKRTFAIHLKWISPVAHEGVRKALIFVNRSSFA